MHYPCFSRVVLQTMWASPALRAAHGIPGWSIRLGCRQVPHCLAVGRSATRRVVLPSRRNGHCAPPSRPGAHGSGQSPPRLNPVWMWVGSGLVAAAAACGASVACDGRGRSPSDHEPRRSYDPRRSSDAPQAPDSRARQLTSLTSLFSDKSSAPVDGVVPHDRGLGPDDEHQVPWTYFFSWLGIGLTVGTIVGVAVLRVRKSTDAQLFIDSTLRLLEGHGEVYKALGKPLRPRSEFKGDFTHAMASGSFKCAGPETRAVVDVVASTDPESKELRWVYQRLDVEVQRRNRSFIISVAGPGGRTSGGAQ